MTTSGVIDIASNHSVTDTIDRLEALARSNGLLVFARIDFGGDAGKAGLEMRPMQMLAFGNPKAGTPLLRESPRSGLDLPLKALAWEDEDGRTWLSYNRPDYLAQRHGVHDRGPAVQAMTAALEALARAATGAQAAPNRPAE